MGFRKLKKIVESNVCCVSAKKKNTYIHGSVYWELFERDIQHFNYNGYSLNLIAKEKKSHVQ